MSDSCPDSFYCGRKDDRFFLIHDILFLHTDIIVFMFRINVTWRNRMSCIWENVFIFYKCRRDSSIKVEEFEKSTIRNMLIGSIKNYIKIGLMSKSYGRKTNVNWLVMIEGLADQIKNSPIWKKAEQTTGPLQLLRPFTAFLVPAGLLSWAVLNQNIYRAKQLFVGVF